MSCKIGLTEYLEMAAVDGRPGQQDYIFTGGEQDVEIKYLKDMK